jgi:hypothetical protein
VGASKAIEVAHVCGSSNMQAGDREGWWWAELREMSWLQQWVGGRYPPTKPILQTHVCRSMHHQYPSCTPALINCPSAKRGSAERMQSH